MKSNKKKYNIQTILLHQKDNQSSKPIINLNSNDILELSFDDLNDKPQLTIICRISNEFV